MDVYVPLACIIAGLLAVIEIFRIDRRLDRMEAVLERLLPHRYVDPHVSVEPSEAVKLLAADPGSYVEAIRTYRQQTGLGLKSAKAVIDRLASSN